MMNFNGPNFVYECVPPVLGNEASDNPVVIGLRGVSVPSFDKVSLEQAAIRLENQAAAANELVTASTYQFTKEHFAFVKNLTVDGKEITDFDSFYANAPSEFVHWVKGAIQSTQILTGAERGNS